MNKKIDFLKLYESLFNGISSGSIEELINLAYKEIGLPILAVDITYNLLGACPKSHTNDYYWDYLLDHKSYKTDMTVQLYTDGIMQSVNNNKAPYVIDWGVATNDLPKILGLIKVDDVVEGYVCMQCHKGQINDDLLKAMEILQDACSILLKDSDSSSAMHLAYYKTFVNELFNDKIHSQKDLDTWKNNTDFYPKGEYQVLAINTSNKQEKNVLSYISKQLEQLLIKQLFLIEHNILYILLYEVETNTINYKDIMHILNSFGAYCGVSNTFNSLLFISDYKKQANDALDIGKNKNPKDRLYYYKDYYLPSILYPQTKLMSPQNYISPIIFKVLKYDSKHSTDLFKTLKTYIYNLCDTNKSSNELHIHRNSLLYRINKIEELCEIDLKDHDTFLHLMISFYMLDIDDNHKKIDLKG